MFYSFLNFYRFQLYHYTSTYIFFKNLVGFVLVLNLNKTCVLRFFEIFKKFRYLKICLFPYSFYSIFQQII